MSNEELVCGKLEHRKKYPDCEKCAAKIAAIAASFTEDAKRSHIKKERSPYLLKRIKEVDMDLSLVGEGSPYWNYVLGNCGPGNYVVNGEDVRENALSNPDVLSEESDLYNRAISSEAEIRIQAIREATAECTPQQQKIMTASLYGVWSEVEGQRIYTEQAIADELKVSRSTVKTLLIRIRAKVQRRYERLKVEETRR